MRIDQCLIKNFPYLFLRTTLIIPSLTIMEFDNIPLDNDSHNENKTLSSTLLDEITCAICLDVYEEPKRTSCLHVACRRCLEEYHHSCKNEMNIATCKS